MLAVRVLLIDPNHVARIGTRSLLDEAPEIDVVGEATSGAQVIDLVEKLKPDVLLIEVRLPDMTGVEVARRLRERQVAVNVLALSAYGDPHYIFGMLEEGAAGYLTKDEEPERIVRAVREVAHGEEEWFSRRVMKRLRTRGEGGGQAVLSPREIEILRLIANGLEGEEIAARLALSTSTVKNHVAHILEKLHARTRAQAVAHACWRGLLPAPESERRRPG